MKVHFFESSLSPIYFIETWRGTSVNPAARPVDAPRKQTERAESPARVLPRGILGHVMLNNIGLQGGHVDEITRVEPLDAPAGITTGSRTLSCVDSERQDQRDHSYPSSHHFEAEPTRNTDTHEAAFSHPANRTEPMPIPGRVMKRTPSEQHLQIEEALADYRDYCMCRRIVDGMIQNHRSRTSNTADTIQRITKTRQQPVEKLGPSASKGSFVPRCDPFLARPHLSMLSHPSTSSVLKNQGTINPSREWHNVGTPPLDALPSMLDDPVSSLYCTKSASRCPKCGEEAEDYTARLSLMHISEGGFPQSQESTLTRQRKPPPKQLGAPFGAYFSVVDLGDEEEGLFQMDDV